MLDIILWEWKGVQVEVFYLSKFYLTLKSLN